MDQAPLLKYWVGIGPPSSPCSYSYPLVLSLSNVGTRKGCGKYVTCIAPTIGVRGALLLRGGVSPSMGIVEGGLRFGLRGAAGGGIPGLSAAGGFCGSSGGGRVAGRL